MALKRVILELGTGNDLHGGDYTKAALRAVQDALHHSSMSMIRSLGLNSKEMQLEVTIGVQRPDKVNAAAVQASLPHGQVTVRVVKGGLDVPEDDRDDITVIASAAVAVRFELP
ncbi:MAG: Lin0512 family protein [Betaproteobacteria bacterium]|nr:Lin0512 family protein [Betaproteobacteria bacterium]